MNPRSTYRPALRALVFGLAAVIVRAGSVGVVVLATARDGVTELDFSFAMQILAIADPIGTILALAGVAYAAIAAHRREWGAALVVAWVLNVAAVLFAPEPFIYFQF